MTDLVLSLYPGADLLGRAFELEGFAVVRGPDILWGQDIRTFHSPPGHFSGVIGGPPCVEYSSANRDPAPHVGDELVTEFLRVAVESGCAWFLMECVPRVPCVIVQGYHVQRIDVCGSEVGLRQRRLRHFQFGRVTELAISVPRSVTGICDQPAAVASEGKRATRRTWSDFCALQGVEPLHLPGLTKEARYRIVGNAVPLPMGRLLASAIARWRAGVTELVCACGCARPVTRRRTLATVGCRKRMERQRRGTGVTARSLVYPAPSRDAAGVTEPGPVTPGGSLCCI